MGAGGGGGAEMVACESDAVFGVEPTRWGAGASPPLAREAPCASPPCMLENMLRSEKPDPSALERGHPSFPSGPSSSRRLMV